MQTEKSVFNRKFNQFYFTEAFKHFKLPNLKSDKSDQPVVSDVEDVWSHSGLRRCWVIWWQVMVMTGEIGEIDWRHWRCLVAQQCLSVSRCVSSIKRVFFGRWSFRFNKTGFFNNFDIHSYSIGFELHEYKMIFVFHLAVVVTSVVG